MKPIVRWTIGGTDSKESYDCLRRSIFLWKKIYKDEFDYYVCHNNTNIDQLELNVKKINQHEIFMPFNNNVENTPTAWKLLPPRINKNVHEIFIDNDLIIYKKLEEVNNFLNSRNTGFITEGLGRNYGCFETLISKNTKTNSGFFGIPPNFDIEKYIKIHSPKYWSDYFDEQGMISFILSKYLELKIISIKKISILIGETPLEKLLSCGLGTHGLHFCGMNKEPSIYWSEYVSRKIKLI